MPALNPCPFCGEPAKLEAHESIPWVLYLVQCDSCGAVGPHAATKREAIHRWNLRALAFEISQEVTQ